MSQIQDVDTTRQSQLCGVCTRLIARANQLDLPRDNFEFEYHANAEDWTRAVAEGCVMCRYMKAEMASVDCTHPITVTLYAIEPESICENRWWVIAKGILEFDIAHWKPESLELQRMLRALPRKGIANSLSGQRRIPNYECVTSSGSEPCLGLINYWINRCRGSHPQCERLREPSLAEWMPTRLVYCGPGNLRLQDSSEIGSLVPYMSLSHCWGELAHRVCLTSASLDAWKKELPDLSHMKTFQDAIEVTRACGLSYIWIDSLCIIQDSRKDWAAESALMDRVYKFAYCNISASDAENTTKGCFWPRSNPPSATFELREPISPDTNTTSGNGVYEIGSIFLERYSIVNTRGWILQERVMSPRIIHFCKKQIYWECDHTSASENLPDGVRFHNDRVKLFSNIIDEPHDCPPGANDAPLQTWMDVLQVYADTKLTKREDILIAVSAIARVIQQQLQCRYLAGIFEVHVLHQLCWCVCNGSRQAERDNEAPSWSWASVPGWQFAYFSEADLELAEYKDAHIEPRDDDIFGRVSGGHIELRGSILPVDCSGHFDEDEQQFKLKPSNRQRGNDGDLHSDFGELDVSMGPDFRESPTEMLWFLPLFAEQFQIGVAADMCGLALEQLRPGVYRRIGLIQAYKVPVGSSWYTEVIGTYMPPAAGEAHGPIIPRKSCWQSIIIE